MSTYLTHLWTQCWVLIQGRPPLVLVKGRDGWMFGGWIDRWILTRERDGRKLDEWIDRQMNGWRVDGWMDGWMDG